MAKQKKTRKAAYTTERYSTETLHEEREYGLYWYAWLWKIIRPILIFLCSALIVIGMVTYGYDKVYEALFSPVDELSAAVVTFEVQSGESVSTVGSNLQQNNLIRSSTVFKYLVQLEGLTEKLSYGTYKLSPSMTVDEIIGELTSGSQTNERVITIIPGWTCEDIADYLLGIGAIESTDAFLTACNNVDLFVGSSNALRAASDAGTLTGRKYALEGYLAPDTYRIFLSATPESIINTMLTQNNEVIDSVFYTDTADYTIDSEGQYQAIETYESDLTVDQMIILASIIEKEAANELDYGRVSAVFHNRLKLGWQLQSDATASYMFGTSHYIMDSRELSDDNAYNTYIVSGLPAGPICNPSVAALNAAMNPDMDYINAGYLYFCAAEPDSGLLVFAKTQEEHEANVAKYKPSWEEYDNLHGQ